MRLIILITLLCVTLQSKSEVNAGILAGVSNSTFLKKNVTTGQDYVVIKMPYSDYGVHCGGFLQFNKSLFLFQPELYFSSISNSYKISKPLSAAEAVYRNDRYFNCEFPVLMGVKIGVLTLKAGPSGRYVLYSAKQLEDYTGYKVMINNSMWSMQTAVGLQINKFQCNVKYEIGLSKVADGIVVDGVKRTFDTRSNQIIVSLGLAL